MGSIPVLAIRQGIPLPLREPEKRYTAWQEATRKDIERAFGVLQSRFQVIAKPFVGHSFVPFALFLLTCFLTSACLRS
jgi:hypothetical protein